MKRDGRVRQQYKQVKYRARKKLIEKSLRVEPCNCCFHVPVSPDRGSRVVLCGYAEMAEDPEWDVVLCDLVQAKECENFVTAATSEEVKRRFDRFLAYAEDSGDAQAMGALAFHYPDLAALLWVFEPWEDEEKVSCTVCGGRCDPQSPCESCVAEGGCSCGATVTDTEDSGPGSVPVVHGGSNDPVEEDEEDEEDEGEEQKVPPDQVRDEDDEGHLVETSAEALRRFDTPFFPWLTPKSLVWVTFVISALILLLLWLEYK